MSNVVKSTIIGYYSIDLLYCFYDNIVLQVIAEIWEPCCI